MANAKKCDRCESFYDVYAFEVKRNVKGPKYEINNMTLGKGLNNYVDFLINEMNREINEGK